MTSSPWAFSTWIQPFDLTPGAYSFSVRATDDLGLTTSSSDQGRLTINVQVPGDAPPNGLLDVTGTPSVACSPLLNLTGTATDDFGVASVRVALRDADTGRYLQPNGTQSSAFATLSAVLAAPNALSTAWSLPVTLPNEGDWRVTAYAYDTVGQQDLSTSGATATLPDLPRRQRADGDVGAGAAASGGGLQRRADPDQWPGRGRPPDRQRPGGRRQLASGST